MHFTTNTIGQIEETLSQLKEGDRIRFKEVPHLLGISSEAVDANFVRWDQAKQTMTYTITYLEPSICRGSEKTIDYNRLMELHRGPSGETGPG